MNTVERRHEIVQQTLDKGKVSVPDLANKYQVSEVTIRADLNYLDQKNLLIRLRGGALACNTIPKELSIDEKHGDQLDIKKKLALIARDQI
ncbi:MAG: DeoR family transcriptional regulator, partial [Colwellia sp.]